MREATNNWRAGISPPIYKALRDIWHRRSSESPVETLHNSGDVNRILAFYTTAMHEFGHNADSRIMPRRTLDIHESRVNPTRLLGIIELEFLQESE